MIAGCGVGCLERVALAGLLVLFLATAAAFYVFRVRRALAREILTSTGLAKEAELREARLQQTLAAHDLLTREFHHRVKNSLQIIQSYLTLSQRQKLPPHNIHLAELEAKVQVISTAYRLALSEGEMRPIPIRSFVQGIVESTQAILCGPFTRIAASIEVEGSLVLDRAIPLGLSIVEAMIGALGDAATTLVRIRIAGTEKPAGVETPEMTLVISTDAEPPNVTLPLRLMRGLQCQLGAKADTCQTGELLNWRFSI